MIYKIQKNYCISFSMIHFAVPMMLSFSLCALVGCATVSRPQPEFAKFANPPDPAAILAVFRRGVPKRFTERQTAILDSTRGRMASIGVCSFDKNKGRFALALMTPTGVKLLQIEKRDGEIISHFYLPGVSPSKRAGPQIAEDSWRIYAHPDSEPSDREICGNRILFTWRDGTRTETLVFGRSANSAVFDLKTKIIALDGRDECVIHYFKYRDMPDGKRRAELITYENKRFDYYLTIKRVVCETASLF
jgi:hypothetical protein